MNPPPSSTRTAIISVHRIPQKLRAPLTPDRLNAVARVFTSHIIPEEQLGRQTKQIHGGDIGDHQGLWLCRPRPRPLHLLELLDGQPSRQGSQEVQGLLPHSLRDRIGEQGRQAIQLRPERAPELARDDADFLCHAAFERALLPHRRSWARRLIHRRPLLLLQGLRHRRAREQIQDRSI